MAEKETKTISVRDGKDYSYTKAGIEEIKNYWNNGWDLESMDGRTEESGIGRYSFSSTPYVDLHFVRNRSIPIIARLAELEKELEKVNEKVKNFKFPYYVPTPNEPVKSNFFFGIGYKAAYEIYEEKLAAWEKNNERYFEAKAEAKAEAEAEAALLEINRAKIREEIESLRNDDLRQSSLRQALQAWENRPRRESSISYTG